MKLLLTVVQDQDAPPLLEALIKGNYRVTKLASTGGFLQAGNTTLLVGIEDNQVDTVMGIIKEICRHRQKTVTPVPPLGGTAESFVPFPVQVTVGGAAVFVIDVEQFIRI
ncbi:MAG TPA: hypothetical protein GX735_03280 [Firmicutes bacterium]|jgi:uncharacterized protein YaaQ|nr:hypothetical protein [Bacillota bacterium]